MINMPEVYLFSLIAMRISGFVLLNPIFGRKNIPAIVKGGFIMVLSLFLFTYTPSRGMVLDMNYAAEYILLLIKEFLMGFVLGFVVQLFFYVVALAGSMIDFHMGMSMASVFDPQSNMNLPLTGSALNAMMILMFFAVDGHLALLKILLESERVVPYTELAISVRAMDTVLKIFSDCTVLAVKLSFPILALELLAEAGVGILMRMIPQINVLMVNIQVKVFVGNLLMLLLCVPIGQFVSNLVDQMMETTFRMLTLL